MIVVFLFLSAILITVLRIWWVLEKLYFELTDFTQDNHNPED